MKINEKLLDLLIKESSKTDLLEFINKSFNTVVKNNNKMMNK